MASAQSLFFKRQDLYVAYRRELICDIVQGEIELEPDYKSRSFVRLAVLNSDIYEWIDIVQGDELVGFLLICLAPNACIGCDLAIEAAYVKPEFREQGLMTKAVTEYVTAHPSVWSLVVIRKNTYARKFWLNLFTNLGYKRIHTLRFEDGLPDSEELFGFVRI